MAISIGEKAPDFELPGTEGASHALMADDPA
jgi:peroxiredoxin